MDTRLVIEIVGGVITLLLAIIQIIGGLFVRDKLAELAALRADVREVQRDSAKHAERLSVLEASQIAGVVEDHAGRLTALEGKLEKFEAKLDFLVEFAREQRNGRKRGEG